MEEQCVDLPLCGSFAERSVWRCVAKKSYALQHKKIKKSAQSSSSVTF
jgi:hypothetical protein